MNAKVNMIQISNRDYRKQFAFVASLICITTLLSFSKLEAEEPTWRLIPDEIHKTVWRVGSNGAISKIKLPVYYEEKNCKFCNFEIRPSPDQSKIAYIKKNDLWIYDIEKKKDKRCTKVGRPLKGSFADVYISIITWSPDSKNIIYSVDHGQLMPGDSNIPDKVPKENYGTYILDIAKGTSSSFKFISNVWLPNGKFLLIRGDLPLKGQIHLYDPEKNTTQPILQEQAWYNIPQVSANGRWAIIHADQTVGPDNGGTGKNLGTQLRKIDLENGKFINITPVGSRGDYYPCALSPSGNRVAYFVYKQLNRLSINRNNYSGYLIVDNVEIYSSELSPLSIYWINEQTIVISTMLEELIVLDAQSGKVIGSCQCN